MTTLDIREIEAGIREAYKRLDFAARDRYVNPANWEGRNGAAVDLADLREALPAEWSKEQVDAALGLLCDHADVHMYPKSDQKNAPARDAEAAVFVGATHHHAIQIERRTPEPERVVERLRMRERDYAESQVAALDDATVAKVAEQMGVEADAEPAVLRQKLIEKSVSNLDTWRADAKQGQDDGTLLYRADTDPEWVASWTDDDRQAAAEAASRLQERAATDPHWAFVKDRAARWAQPAPAEAAPQDGTGTGAHQDTGEPPAPTRGRTFGGGVQERADGGGVFVRGDGDVVLRGNVFEGPAAVVPRSEQADSSSRVSADDDVMEA